MNFRVISGLYGWPPPVGFLFNMERGYLMISVTAYNAVFFCVYSYALKARHQGPLGARFEELFGWRFGIAKSGCWEIRRQLRASILSSQCSNCQGGEVVEWGPRAQRMRILRISRASRQSRKPGRWMDRGRTLFSPVGNFRIRFVFYMEMWWIDDNFRCIACSIQLACVFIAFVFLLVATRDLLKIADIENLLKRMVPVWLHTYSGDQRPKNDP